MERSRRWIVTFGGIGMARFAPGTAASLATSALLGAIYFWLHPSAIAWDAILVVLLLAASTLTVAYGPWAVVAYGTKDPGAFVLDEVAGICLTMLGQPMHGGWREALVIAAAFVAFRLFDIWKPWPCPALERLPGGWGILMDDLMAAVYANGLCQLALRFAFA